MMKERLKWPEDGGFTLVELLVVLAIVAILMAMAVPAARMFTQGDQERGARELYSLLRAARVYAATYRVTTAVAYDVVPYNAQDPHDDYVADTLYGGTWVQTLRGAMMVYELPSNRSKYAGYYVPVPSWDGYRAFTPGYCVLMQKVPQSFDAPPGSAPGNLSVYWDPDTRRKQYSVSVPPDLGLRVIKVLNETPVIEGAANLSLWDSELDEQQDTISISLAHCFDQTGKLIPPEGQESKERFRILFAPSPDRPQPERISTLRRDDTISPENPSQIKDWLEGGLPDTFTMLGVPIEIFRSTGRVAMGKL